jgi:biopolymer transport protein ExbD
MAKIKMNRKSVSLDMTAMCDMAFLLLNFFILTAQFKPEEPVTVITPSSVSDVPVPQTNLMTITIDKNGRIFFGVEGQFVRDKMVRDMAGKYQVGLTEAQIKEFSLTSTFGSDIRQLGAYLDLSATERQKLTNNGVPCDTANKGENNQLRDWIAFARYANMPNPMRIAIKGDNDANAESIKRVIATLQDQNINKFNLVTGLEAKPDLSLFR